MKCRICQGPLQKLTFRALAPHFHFPAHGDSDLGACLQELMSKNFAPIYKEFSEIVELSYHSVKGDIADAILDQTKAFELLINQTELKTFIQTNFPESYLTDFQNISWHLTQVNLDAETYRRLIAYELKCGSTVRPRRLREVAKEILYRLETGQIPITHSLYYERMTFSQRSQLIEIPFELKQAISSANWVSKDHSLERLLLIFAETLNISHKYEKLAYSVIRNEFKPSKTSHRTKVIKIIDIPGSSLVDKKRGLKLALQSANVEMIQKILHKIPDTHYSQLRSLRIDSEDKAMIDYLARQFNVPLYKMATSLLMWADLTRR